MVRVVGLPCAAVVVSMLGLAMPVFAQSATPAASDRAPASPSLLALAPDRAPLARSAAAILGGPLHRPAPLVPLYATFVGLQTLDVHSTQYALARGATEGNPVIRGLAGNELALVALKAAGTAGVIVANERLWKRNRTAAIVAMVAANSAMAWVVQHNYRTPR